MLADEPHDVVSGRLVRTLHVDVDWLDTLIDFVSARLPEWRIDVDRPDGDGETDLTAQLCSFLNSSTALQTGFDVIQFKQEEPDRGPDGRRRIDLAILPKAAIVWVAGRRNHHYSMLVPIECKRLPTPGREEREYLFTDQGSTGGVERFKQGHHASRNELAAIIGYVQDDDIDTWHSRVNGWVRDLVKAAEPLWSADDLLSKKSHDLVQGVAELASVHARHRQLAPIRLRHLWIEMDRETSD